MLQQSSPAGCLFKMRVIPTVTSSLTLNSSFHWLPALRNQNLKRHIYRNLRVLSLILALMSSWAFSRFLLSDLLSELDCSQHRFMRYIITCLSWNQQSPLNTAVESSGNVFVYVWHCCQYSLCSYYRQAETSYFYAAGMRLCYTDRYVFNSQYTQMLMIYAALIIKKIEFIIYVSYVNVIQTIACSGKQNCWASTVVRVIMVHLVYHSAPPDY